jgi:Cu(I)/Ag(I) efflux system membrane protein CusA/SilA
MPFWRILCRKYNREGRSEVIESAIGGQHITPAIEGRGRYPVTVRYAQGFRDTLPDQGRLLVKTPVGGIRRVLLAG